MLQEFPYEEGRVVVLVDDRELRGVACRKLFELGAHLSPTRLPIGDFVCSPKICFERKTASDFESSVIDGRLFAQAAELSANFPSCLIGVIGREFARISPQAMRGAVLSLVTDYRIPVLFFDDESEFAHYVYSAAWREQLAPEKETKLRFEKHSMGEQELRRFIVESLPGIGPKTAKALLEHFGSVENVFTAEEEELAEVEGVGAATARVLRKLISSR